MKDSKQNYKEIHDILLMHWDPIGVKGIPEAENEYDSCISAIVSLLNADVEVEQVCEELMMIAIVNMGVPKTDELLESSKKVAQELLAFKKLR